MDIDYQLNMEKLFLICNIVKRNRQDLFNYIEEDSVSRNVYCYIHINDMLN